MHQKVEREWDICKHICRKSAKIYNIINGYDFIIWNLFN